MEWLAFPAWVTEILKQSPVVVLCGVVLWRAASYFDGKHRAELASQQSQHDAHNRTLAEATGRHIDDLKAQHAKQVDSMEREIDRLVVSLAETTKDRDRLLRRLIPDDKKD